MAVIEQAKEVFDLSCRLMEISEELNDIKRQMEELGPNLPEGRRRQAKWVKTMQKLLSRATELERNGTAFKARIDELLEKHGKEFDSFLVSESRKGWALKAPSV